MLEIATSTLVFRATFMKQVALGLLILFSLKIIDLPADQCDAVLRQEAAFAAEKKGDFEQAISILSSTSIECRLWTQLFNTYALYYKVTEDTSSSENKKVDLLEIRVNALGSFIEFLKTVSSGVKLVSVAALPMLIEIDEFDLAIDHLERKIQYLQNQAEIQISDVESKVLKSQILITKKIQEILIESESKEDVILRVQNLNIQQEFKEITPQ